MTVHTQAQAAEPSRSVPHKPADDEARSRDNVSTLVPPAPDNDASPKKKRRGLRIGLILSVPLLLAVAGGYFWLTGGRYIATDNAYVKQMDVAVSADVSGRITDVLVSENQAVKAGDVLFRIDPKPYRIALDSADAALAQARLQVQQLRADYHTAAAKLSAAQSTAAMRKRTLARSQDLADKGFAAPANLDQAQLAATQANNDVALARQSVDAAVAALDGKPDAPVDDHPAVLSALADREQAELDLSHATVRAPEAGIVSQVDMLSRGQYVTAGTSMLSIVENSNTWIEANFKETQLTDMHAGQPVDVSIDTYPDLDLKGTVGSIDAATGSEFSLIPAQNATGNWVKVVQRIPVRIAVPQDIPVVLRAGMSANVDVDTGQSRLDKMMK